MGRLTPLGTFLVLLFFVVVIGGALALTDNLRWPPFGITLDVAPGSPTPVSAPPAGVPTAVAQAPAGPTDAAAAPPPSATLPPPSPTSTPTSTSTPTPVPPSPTPTPTPLGVVYAGSIDSSGGTHALPAAVDPDSHRLYVVSVDDQGNGVLQVYDETSLTKVKEAPLEPTGLSTNPLVPPVVVPRAADHRVYVVGGNGRVVALDSDTLALVRAYNMGIPVERAFLSPDGTRLFGLESDQPGSTGAQMHVLNLKAAISDYINIPARWSADSAFVDGGTLYLTGRDGLLPIDMATLKAGQPIQLGFQPLFPAFDATTHMLYAWRQPQTVPLVPRLVVLDLTTQKAVASMTMNNCPCPLAVNPARRRLYIAMPTAPGHVLAYTTGGQLVNPDEVVLQSVPALNVIVGPSASRLYVPSTGPHAILVLQDNGPAPPGRGPLTIPIK